MTQPVLASFGAEVVDKTIGRGIGRVAWPVDVKAADDQRIKDDSVCKRTHVRSLPQDGPDQANTAYGLRVSATETIYAKASSAAIRKPTRARLVLARLSAIVPHRIYTTSPSTLAVSQP